MSKKNHCPACALKTLRRMSELAGYDFVVHTKQDGMNIFVVPDSEELDEEIDGRHWRAWLRGTPHDACTCEDLNKYIQQETR